jgi:hypothetical protein
MPDQVTDQLAVIRRQLQTGMNTRGHGTLISESQGTKMLNTDLFQPGRTKKRAGYESKFDAGASMIENAVRFNPSGGTDSIILVEGTNLKHWNGTTLSAAIKTDLTDGLYTLLLVGNNICLVSNGTDNVHSVDSAWSITDEADTDTDPPKAVVGCYFKDRYMMAKDDTVYFSNVASTTFDRTANFFRVNVGDNSAGNITNMIPFRNDEMLIFKEDSVWILSTTGNTTPLSEWNLQPVQASTPDVTSYGCISKQGAVRVGDDIYYWARDGIRTIKRNEQDKVQGIDLPISDLIYPTWVESINWGQATKIRATFFRNRVIFAVPYGASAHPDHWFVYNIQLDGKHNGWAVWENMPTSTFVRYPKSGQDNLYFADGQADGKMYLAFDDYISDNGTVITWDHQARVENFSDQGLEANLKWGASLFLRFEASADSTCEIEVNADEQGFDTLGTVDLDADQPRLPIGLSFDLKAGGVIRAKFSLDQFDHWYNIQLRFRQTGTDMTVSLLEYMIIAKIENYEYDVY